MLSVLQCSIDTSASGGGTDVTNPVVLGQILFTSGKPAANTQVQIIPVDFNPGVEILPDSMKVTTDSNGMYSFRVSSLYSYNIQAVHLTQRTRSLRMGIHGTGIVDTLRLPDDTLKVPGLIKVFLPDTIDTSGAYVYVKGTQIFESLSNAVVDSEGVSISIDSVPEAQIPGIQYNKLNNPVSPILISDTLQVVSKDTSSIGALIFWANYSKDNSPLPDNQVQDVVIDSEGNHWYGTFSGGVAKYNGNNWTIFNTTNSSIPSTNVLKVAEGANKSMLFATFGGAATLHNETAWEVFSMANSDIPSDRVTSIAQDSNGNIWVGTYNGVAMFNGTIWTVYTKPGSNLPSDKISALAIDNLNNIWIATDDGAGYFNGASWEIYDTTTSDIYMNMTSEVFINKNGNVWFGHQNGASKYDGNQWETFDPSELTYILQNANEICGDTFGNIYFAGFAGLSVYTGGEWKAFTGEKYHPLENKKFYSMDIDKHNNVWLGTGDFGVIGFGPTIK